MARHGRISWRSGDQGYETRAVLVDDAGGVLHTGRIIPYTFREHADESDARSASARDVIDWAAANDVTILDDLGPGDAGTTAQREAPEPEAEPLAGPAPEARVRAAFRPFRPPPKL
jgi:hypothetical protein